MTRARSLAARLLLDASGLAGGAGPVLAAACARVADALAWAAERVAPLTPCPGCGAAVPSLDLEVVGVCGECAEREAAGPLPAPVDVRGLAWPRARHDTDPSATKPN